VHGQTILDLAVQIWNYLDVASELEILFKAFSGVMIGPQDPYDEMPRRPFGVFISQPF
jgi:hypothetical protein